MICYRDMSFCASDCTRSDCDRHWDDEKRQAADDWWGKPGAPVAFMDFSWSCPSYVVAEAEEVSDD